MERQLEAASTAFRPSHDRSPADVAMSVLTQAREATGISVGAFVVESGVCVFIGGEGSTDPTAVAQAVTQKTTAKNAGTIAAPVMVNDQVVAVVTSADQVDGQDMTPRLTFLCEMMTARLLRPVESVPRTAVAPPPDDLPFRPLFDAAEFILMVLDPAGKIIYANPFVERLTGFSVGDLLGVSVANRAAYSPAPTEREFDLHHQRVSQGIATSGEVSMKVNSGEIRTFSFTLSPIHDDEGQLTHVLASALDVTERKAAEHRLHLANEALEQARIQAETSAAARSDFLARMSHEIRTPLNAIIGTTTLMLDRIEDEVDSEYTEILRSSADHLLAVINDILDITKLEAHDGPREEDAVFSVAALVESSLDLVMGTAASKGLEVTSLIEPGTPSYLRGDAPRARQVLVNLLSNAVKFTNSGVVELVARGHYIAADRVELVFDIRDTGPGISPNQLDALFDPFVRGENNPPGIESTGLGLAICERIVHMLDGTINVQSTVGVGTHFTVSIPFPVHTDVTDDDEDEIPEAFDGLSVLIVDDIELNRRVLELETRRWGMKPTLCASPLDALALIEGGRRFDIALLDLNMPEMNGDELAERMANRNDCPKVLLSSTSVEHTPHFSAHLTKPIKRHQLSRAIKRALDEGPRGSTPESDDRLDDELRILLAEDNIVNQKVADALLQRLGHVPTIVGDGDQVLARLEESRYDLVLLDLRMPNRGGIDTAAEIVRRYGGGRPRLVAFTASATEGDRQRCLDVGMDDFVTKPVTLDGLRRVLSEARTPVAR